MRSYVIGRSPYADVVLADTSVAGRHAEILVTDDGRFYLTDCAAEAGTWRLADGAEPGERWEPVRQDFVVADEPLRLGDHRCTVATLLGAKAGREGAHGVGSWHHDGPPDTRFARPRGRVERDPETGEIVQKRL